MTVTLLDFSLKAELQPVGEVVAPISAIARGLGIHCFITGALARDLWIAHHLGVQIARQTNDVDFAIAVARWEDFHALRKGLLDSGEFRDAPRAPLHRLRHRNGIPMDLVPFGGIERAETRSIAWPPDNSIVMSVFGFREAAEQTVEVRFPRNAIGQVVTLPALAVLKFDAWADRHIRDPQKDAYDLLLIIRNYASVSGERLYDANPYLAGSPSDYEAAGAWLLGKDMARLLDEAGHERLARIIADEADEAGQLRLVGDMTRNDPERALELLAALEDGFIGERNEQ